MLMTVSMVLLSTLTTVYTHAYDRKDMYGVYSLDRSGSKVYSQCYERDALPRDQCRDYRARHNYIDRQDYGGTFNSYDRNDIRDKLCVGKGYYRIVNGVDAELICEFPRGSHFTSNIVWEKHGARNYQSRSNSLRDSLGRRMEVESIGNFGSALIIRDWTQRDTGTYFCVATRSSSSNRYNPSYRDMENIYIEVDFTPQNRDYTEYRPSSSNRYDDYRPAYDQYRPSLSRYDQYRPSRYDLDRPSRYDPYSPSSSRYDQYRQSSSRYDKYRPSSFWRTSSVETSADTEVTNDTIENNNKKKV